MISIDDFISAKIYEDIGVTDTTDATYPKARENDLVNHKNWKAFIGTGLNARFSNITHASLWESYVKALEYIDKPEEFEFPSTMDKLGHFLGFNAYYDPLRYMRKNVPCRDNKTFLQASLLLFDIIFSAPVLPQCVLLRSDSMFDYDLSARFYAVNEAASALGPVSEFSSAEEYVASVCYVLGWTMPDTIYFQLFRCWDSISIIPAGRTFQYFLISRLTGDYPTFNRQSLFDALSQDFLTPCFLKLSDKMIRNTRMIYKPGLESWTEFAIKSAMNKWDLCWPEAFENDETYYQYFLLHDLVRKLWFERDKDVVVYVPSESSSPYCGCAAYQKNNSRDSGSDNCSGGCSEYSNDSDNSNDSEKFEAYLQDWIDRNHINARVSVKPMQHMQHMQHMQEE